MGCIASHPFPHLRSNLMEVTSFSPVRYSAAANEFLLAHLGEPSSVALKDIKGQINQQAAFPAPGRKRDTNPIVYPDGIVPQTIKPLLDTVYELIDLEKRGEIKWVGIEAIKDAIKVWVRENKKWAEAHKRNPKIPRWPSRYTFDGKGNARIGGPGSDSEEVKTYFGPAGERIPFEIELVVEDAVEFNPPISSDKPFDSRLVIDTQNHRIECKVPKPDGTFCGFTASYRGDNRSSYNAARARMSQHLRRATDEVEAHRELHTLEFSSGNLA